MIYRYFIDREDEDRQIYIDNIDNINKDNINYIKFDNKRLRKIIFTTDILLDIINYLKTKSEYDITIKNILVNDDNDIDLQNILNYNIEHKNLNRIIDILNSYKDINPIAIKFITIEIDNVVIDINIQGYIETSEKIANYILNTISDICIECLFFN